MSDQDNQFVTPLDDDQEQEFQDWVKQNKIPWQDTPDADYDMRGFYKAMVSGDPNAQRSSANLHFPDTWKTPYHQTFSNESIYSAGRPAPHWEGYKLVDDNGNIVADETPLAGTAASKAAISNMGARLRQQSKGQPMPF